MDCDLLIGGVSRECQITSLNILEGVNGKSTLNARIQSENGLYIPALDEAVEFIISGTETRFGGRISEAAPAPWAGFGWLTSITAEDNSALAERFHLKITTPGGFTGRDAIDYLIANGLGALGVTRDPAMPAGAVLGALTYDWATYAEILNDIVRLAAPPGWLWRIDENLVLRAWQPSLGDYPCPFSITSVTQIDGGVLVKPSREGYANTIILEYNDGTAVPAVVTATDAAGVSGYGVYQKVYKAPGPINATVAQAVANSYLETHKQRTHSIEFVTLEEGARAGQTIVVALGTYNLNATYLITEVRTFDQDGADLRYALKAIPGYTVGASWKDTFRQWSGGGNGGGVASVGTVVITVTTPSPSAMSLGGSSTQSVVPGSGAWLPVVDRVPFVAPESRAVTLRVEMWARSAGVTATARLRDLTTPATTITTAGVTGVTPTLVSANGTLVAGRRYELQLSANSNGEGVFGIGSLVFT